MAQNPAHMKSKCPKCGAERGMPCITTNGRKASKVHWGRPYWSGKVRDTPRASPNRTRSAAFREAYDEYENRAFPN